MSKLMELVESYGDMRESQGRGVIMPIGIEHIKPKIQAIADQHDKLLKWVKDAKPYIQDMDWKSCQLHDESLELIAECEDKP